MDVVHPKTLKIWTSHFSCGLCLFLPILPGARSPALLLMHLLDSEPRFFFDRSSPRQRFATSMIANRLQTGHADYFWLAVDESTSTPPPPPLFVALRVNRPSPTNPPIPSYLCDQEVEPVRSLLLLLLHLRRLLQHSTTTYTRVLHVTARGEWVSKSSVDWCTGNESSQMWEWRALSLF